MESSIMDVRILTDVKNRRWNDQEVTWQISATDLNTLWFDAFPRIMGRIWHLDELNEKKHGDYKKAFKKREAFRKIQFAKMGISVEEEMRIFFDNKPGEIDLIISNEGITLPFPDKPQEGRILNLYQIRPPGSVGWRLPGLKVDLCFSNQQRSKFLSVPKAKEHLKKETPKEAAPDPNWRIFGNFYRDLLTVLPKVIAYAWENNSFYESLIEEGNTRNALQGADIYIPEDVPIFIDVTRQNDDCWISNLGILLPFPEKPSVKDFYKAWANGEAGIPTFTNSKT